MLQIALLLLGCALSRYLWEIDITVASVVLGVTLFGVIFYLVIIIAGAVSESCPYQTPGARFLRHAYCHTLCRTLLPALRSAPAAISELSVSVFSKLSGLVHDSGFPHMFLWWRSLFKQPWYSPNNIFPLLVGLYALLVGPVMGVSFLGIVIFFSPFILGLTVDNWFIDASRRTRVLEQQTMLDFRCISWMLQTSLDKAVRLSALKQLESLMPTPTNFNPALVVYCFDVFIGCINVSNCEVMTVQGLEQLATVSARCFYHIVSHLSIMDPTSSAFKDVRQRYAKVFPDNIDFHGHDFSHSMNVIHRVFIRGGLRYFEWSDYKPPGDEYVMIAHALEKLARFKYRRIRRMKVPRSILRFALHSLSLNPLPSTPVIADCLSIIAVDLGCGVSKLSKIMTNTTATALDERCVPISRMTTILTLNQFTSGADFEPDNSETRNNDQSYKPRSTTLVAPQGDCRSPSICSLAGARWAT